MAYFWLTFGLLVFKQSTFPSSHPTKLGLIFHNERIETMKPIDLKDLINGLITVIIIAVSIGQYGKLREFAKKEFVYSMTASPYSIFEKGLVR